MPQVNGLCVLDVDGTLIEEEVIDLLGKEAGCEEAVAQITARAMKGELDFETSLRERVALLKGLPITVFDRVYSEIHLTPNAKNFLAHLQEKEIVVGLVSGGFFPIVERLAKELDIKLFSANFLEVVDGKLTGELMGEIVTRETKQERLLKWAEELQLPKERTIAIGDGANDLSMLKSAGIGVAFCAKEVVKKEILCQIDKRDFLEILHLIDFL